MKVTLFNDTRQDWKLHIGSLRGVNGENRIPAQHSIDFDLPEGSHAFVKVWDTGVVMVRPFVVSPAQAQLPLSDAERTDIEARANQSGALHELQGYCRDELCRRCFGREQGKGKE